MRQETSTKAAAELWRAITSNPEIGVFKTTRDGDVISCNDAFASMIGYKDAGEFLRKSKTMKGVHMSWLAREGLVSEASEMGYSSGDVDLIRADHTVAKYKLSYTSVGDGQFVGLVYDISELVDAQAKLEMILGASVRSISTMAEIRDPYTHGHMVNVSLMTRAIAVELGYSSKQLECLYYASILHDIGKVYVPAELLVKPTKLSDKEFEIIKEHSFQGAKIVSAIPFVCDSSVPDTILSHHERLDGSGYPNGLKGDGIPYDAKIIAVADSMEAMINHRPYRAAMSTEQALEILDAEAESGRLDKKIVEINKKLFETGTFLAE